MAIAFARVSIHSRAKGHSAVAASAYRTASKLTDERTGIVHDYTHRKDVVFAETLLPINANHQYFNRELLWNQVESCEKRIDAQVCKDVVLALPKELDLTHQIELTKRFAQTHFLEHSIPVDIAIHDHGDGNPHAHILATTRRLEPTGFSRLKARDLNPAFYSGRVVEDDYRREQWREMQNEYFKEHQIDLTVDLNHMIAGRHEGRVNEYDHYLKDENSLIREERINLALHHADNMLNHISATHSVFTRRDVEKLIFKTCSQSTLAPSSFSGIVEQVMQHKDVICLGSNEEGKEAYTTRNQYIAESHLLHSIEQLSERRGHVFYKSTKKLADSWGLNEEQREALHYIAKSSDLSVLIGRPGVGKSYLLKPVKEHYEAHGCRVLGTALSGKVAKALQSETGISSYTIASLNYRLQKNTLTLSKDDVIVIDEAGMVDFANLSSVVNAANKARAKVILVGDPDQLKPINKGEIFRGIAAITGFVELSNIRRQRNEGDRQASLMLSQGKIEEALAHYSSKRAIRFSNNVSDSSAQLALDWSISITKSADIKENAMFAFSRVAVASLNTQARELLQKKGILDSKEFVFESVKQDPDTNQSVVEEIRLAKGERVLLRKNDTKLGVRNGDMAFIESINSKVVKVRLDSGEVVSLPKLYQHIDYGYATTVHKGQGMTVDNARVLIDSRYWDRFLSFVAMTRHREKLTIYADKHQHPDLKALGKTLARTATRDNVIDWPLDLAIRYGFEPDGLIGRAINHLAGVGHRVKEKYNYIVNYEAYAKAQMVKAHRDSKQKIREVAKKVADYLDAQSEYVVMRDSISKQAEELKVDAASLKEFNALYEQSVVRDKKAHAVWTEHREQVSDVNILNLHKDDIKRASDRHERYLAIAAVATHQVTESLPRELISHVANIDLEQDKIHVVQLAAQFNKKPSALLQQVEGAQKSHRQEAFNQLKKEHPILAEL
jgi:Ti-type conjugative transfer relaxase TraA